MSRQCIVGVHSPHCAIRQRKPLPMVSVQRCRLSLPEPHIGKIIKIRQRVKGLFSVERSGSGVVLDIDVQVELLLAPLESHDPLRRRDEPRSHLLTPELWRDGEVI